jgi:HD-GYP domain-containing protein (c-di-GMP phosphodiesterase class II)
MCEPILLKIDMPIVIVVAISILFVVIWLLWLAVVRNRKLVGLYTDLETTTKEIKALMSQIVDKGDYSVRTKNPNLVQCWNAKNCVQTTCPSYRHLDNLRCWEVSGTFCRGEVQGVLALKIGDCRKCSVYQAARQKSIFDLGETFNEMILLIDDAHRNVILAKDQLEIHAGKLEELVSLRTKQLTATQDMAVFALAHVVDSRDPETGEHLQRMRNYAQMIAEALALAGPYAELIDQQFLENLYRSSPLHDIGKVAVPDAILQKHGPLTDKEFEEMKKHVVVGGQTLEMARDQVGLGTFMDMAAEIARYHHEKFDGTGYCAGLRGQEIPLSARIVALADVYDALTSRRIYKPPYSPDYAREIIVHESGAHFDPVIVNAFLARFEDFQNVWTQAGNEGKRQTFHHQDPLPTAPVCAIAPV